MPVDGSLLEAIATASGRLFDVIATVERQGYWKRSFFPPYNAPINANVTDFLRKLIAHVILTDGHYSSKEHELVKRLTQTDQTFHESRAQLESAREGSPAFFAEVPAFLTASIAYDIAAETNTAASCVAFIGQLSHLLASTDEVDDLETAYLVRFTSFLKATVESAGVRQDPVRFGSASSSLAPEGS
jgi:uncharacterized tellurite resistance protein B-like protein